MQQNKTIHLISEPDPGHWLHTEKVPCTCNTALVAGSVGGVMGVVILIQLVLVVVLLVIVFSQCNIKKRAERLVMIE